MTSGGYLTVVKTDGSIGKSRRIETGSSIIGTASSCAIRILQNNKKEFAPRQCIITVHPTETIIKNLSFENPTFVNNELFATKVLINGDIITFGGLTFKWEYFNMGPRSNIPVKKSKVGSFPIIKTKGNISRRKSDITIRKVDPKLKKILESKARSSLGALSGPFTSNNRQVAVVKPQRRDVENSNSDEAILEVPIFSHTNDRSRFDNVLSGRRQSKRASAVSSPTYFEGGTLKKRKTNEVKKLDSPVVLDDHKKAALLMLTRTPGNRNILNKPITPVALLSQPKIQEKTSISKQKLLSKLIKKTPSVSSTSKVQLKSKIPNTRIAKSAPPKSLVQQRTGKVTRGSLVSAKKSLLPKYSPKNRNTIQKLSSPSVTSSSSKRQSGVKRLTQALSILEASPLIEKQRVSLPSPGILKTNSSAPGSPRKSVAFESISSPKSRDSNLLSVTSIEISTQIPTDEKIPKTPANTPTKSPKSKVITPKSSSTTSMKRQSSRFSSVTISKQNTPAKIAISTKQNTVTTPKTQSNVSASNSILNMSTNSLKLRSSPKSTNIITSRSSILNESHQSNLKSPVSKRKSIELKTPQSLNGTQPIARSMRKSSSNSISSSTKKRISNISLSLKLKSPNIKIVTPSSNSRNTRRSNLSLNPLSLNYTRNRSSTTVSLSSSKLLSGPQITPTKEIPSKIIVTPSSTPSIRKSLGSKITTSSNKVKVTTPTKKISPVISKTPSPKSKSPSTMVTPVNRSLRNLSYLMSTPKSVHKGVSRISLARKSSAFKSDRKSENELSIRALNLSDIFSNAQDQNTPASTPLPKRNSKSLDSVSKSNRKISSVKMTRLSRQSSSKRSSDFALTLSPIQSPKITRSPKTPPLRSPNLEAMNTTPELSKLFELEASTPKVKDGSRRSSRGKSSNSPISSRKQTRLSRFSKTEPRKQNEKKIIGGVRKSLNLTRKNVNVTPKSTFKLIPEILKEKHSTAKKSISKKFLIESRSEQKDVFSSPLRRKLSQSLRQDSSCLADDLQDNSIANASFELLYGHSIDNSKRSTVSPKSTRLSSNKSKISSPAASERSSASKKSSNVLNNKSSALKGNKSPTNSLKNISPKVLRSPRNNLINVSLKPTPKSVKALRFSSVKKIQSTRSLKNDLSNVSGLKQLLKTPKQTKSPKNDLRNVSGVKRLMMTPKQTKSPKNDLRNVSGVKRLLKTPKQTKSPKNDLRNVSGVKRLLKSPKQTKSPKNDLRNISGVKELMKTPKPIKSPKNDLRNVSGVKRLLKTPKQTKSPKNDLRNVSGVKRLLKSPKQTKSPKNDLRNVSGVKRLMKTPKLKKSPKNDLRIVSGVKRLLKTPKQAKSPKNDLRNVSGVKRLLKTPKQTKSPKNDLRNISGVKRLLKTPKQITSPKNDLRSVSGIKRLLKTPKQKKSPKNDLRNISGVKKLLKTPKQTKSPNISGIKLLVKTPGSVRSRTSSLNKSRSTSKSPVSATNKLQKTPRTPPKTSPVKKSPIKTSSSVKSPKKLPTINTSAFYKKSFVQSPKSPNKSLNNLSILGHSTPTLGNKTKITNLTIRKLSPIKAISSSPAKKSRTLRKRGQPVGIEKKNLVKKIKVTKKIKQELIAVVQAAKKPIPAVVQSPLVSKKSSLKINLLILFKTLLSKEWKKDF